MCGRYRLRRHWKRDLDGDARSIAKRVDVEDPLHAGSDEARPTDRMPILVIDDGGQGVPELRRWGYIMLVDGKTIDKLTGEPKKPAKAVINAMSGKRASSDMWKRSFEERRCLIPMSAWDEWPETGAGRQRVRVTMPSEPALLAAGLYDENVDPKTGRKVPVYTMGTVPPNEFLGTVHDRAPMVPLPSQYDDRLDGGQAALTLVGTHADAGAFEVRPA